MTPIQKIELEALKEIREICMQHKIHFFMRGGSVMGAVKYHGFIPWDDDMDVAIPRPDYERFIKVFSNDWSEHFWMASYRNGDQIHAYFPRILIKESYRKRLGFPTNNHLGFSIIDVLPLDGAPKSFISRKFYKVHVGILRALGAVWTVDVKDTIMIHSSRRQKTISLLKKTGIQRFYTQNQIYRKLEQVYSQYGLDASYLGTITGSQFDREIFPRNVWGRGVFLPFEDIQVRIPDDYDAYLKHMYGDNYLNEEPENKKSHLKNKRVI